VAIFLSGLCGGGLVIVGARVLLTSRPSSIQERLLGITSSFGGGIFLGAGFCHLLADAIEQLHGAADYPLAELCSALGVLLTFLIELAGDCVLASRQKTDHQCRPQPSARSLSSRVSDAPASQQLAPFTADCCPGTDAELLLLSSDRYTAVISFAALSFHSFVAGVAVGTQTAESDGVLAHGASIAIIIHKFVASAALCATLVRVRSGDPPQPVALRFLAAWLMAFALVTPVGVWTGAALGSSLEGPAVGVLTAVASGTFMYLGLVSIATKELKPASLNILAPKLAAVSFGFAAMALLAVWV